MPKAENNFRMGWDNDIPVCLGTNYSQWSDIPWNQLERKVHKLQTRIYQASSRGDIRTVRKLQKTLLHSWSAKCLATRRITQDNTGKKTAGVDGKKISVPRSPYETSRQSENWE